MTLRCLTEAPEVFKAGVAIAPVTDWDGYDTCYTERYMGTPADNPEGYKAASVLTPRSTGSRGDAPDLHGLLDENVHFRHTARLINALIAADNVLSRSSRCPSRGTASREARRVGSTWPSG